jgi:TetR/AcrR family transcriptional regulator
MRKKTRVQEDMGKRVEQKEKQRQNLLDVSLELFVRRGYHGTSVRDIAEQAHISVGLVFHYFSTKQAILEELATFAHVGTSAARNLLAAPLPPLTIFEQIVQMSFHYLEEPAASRLFLLVNQINTLESIPQQIKQIVSSSDVVRASLPIILKGQHMGEIKTGDPLSLSLAFWGALQGIAEVRLWFPDAPVPDSQCIVDILKVSRE